MIAVGNGQKCIDQPWKRRTGEDGSRRRRHHGNLSLLSSAIYLYTGCPAKAGREKIIAVWKNKKHYSGILDTLLFEPDRKKWLMRFYRDGMCWGLCRLVPENIYNHKEWRWKNHKDKEMVWVPSAPDIRCLLWTASGFWSNKSLEQWGEGNSKNVGKYERKVFRKDRQMWVFFGGQGIWQHRPDTVADNRRNISHYWYT